MTRMSAPIITGSGTGPSLQFRPSNWGDLAGYHPEVYAPDLKESLRDNNVMKNLTNSKYQGAFKGVGDKIKVRHKPMFHTRPFVDGQDLVYEDPKSSEEEYEIKRSRYWAFRILDLAKAFSDVKNWSEDWIRQCTLQMDTDIEDEFFATAPQLCYTGINGEGGNAGNHAGRISGNFALGNSVNPVKIYLTQEKADADTGTTIGTGSGNVGDKIPMTDFIANIDTVLAEEPESGNAEGGEKWIVLPPVGLNRIARGELKNASISGDSVSLIRKDIVDCGEISGIHVYKSNRCPKDANGNYICLFGDRSGICYDLEVSKIEAGRFEKTFGDYNRALVAYDWIPVYPERVGYAVLQF